MSSSLKIVFFGTPEFAVSSLRRLCEGGKNIVAVVTAPDRPSGRGKLLTSPEVKKYAQSVGIPVLQPDKLKGEKFIDVLRSIDADLFIVVAFRMLPEVVWNMPRKGTFNLHGSLLPDYRGAAPINWAIMNGETLTGVTTFFLRHEIDTGDIILQEEEPILQDDDAGTLYVRLMDKGADLVLRTVELIEKDQVKTRKQVTTGTPREAPKLFRETCMIDWRRPANDLRNFVRGLSPYPGAWTILNGNQYKIYELECLEGLSLSPGSFLVENNKLLVGTATEAVSILQLQAEGKRRMMTVAYLKGNQI